MKRSAILSLRKIGILEYLNKNKISLLMCFTFVVGCVAASYIYPENEKFKEIISNNFTNYILNREGKSFFKIFLNSFAEHLLFLFLFFLGGSSMFGVVLVPFSVLLKGLYCGGFSALLYSDFALRGVAFNALIFIPPTLVFLLSIFFASKESISFSLKLAHISLRNCPPTNISVEFKNYSVKYILFLFVCVISALIDAGLSTSLLKYFNF